MTRQKKLMLTDKERTSIKFDGSCARLMENLRDRRFAYRIKRDPLLLAYPLDFDFEGAGRNLYERTIVLWEAFSYD